MNRIFIILAALALPALAAAQGVTREGVRTDYVSTAPSGSNGFACLTDGCRFDIGAGANDYFHALGGLIKTPASIETNGTFYGGSASVNNVYPPSVVALSVKGNVADGASAIAVKLMSINTLSTAGAKIASFYRDNGSTEMSWIDLNGWYSGATEHTLWSWWFNAAAATGACPATGTGCTGHTLPNKAFTVTGVTGYVSVVGGGGAGNTVVTITDGTNTCTATFACASVTNSTGSKRVTTANGAGTGCVYAASAALSAYVSTAGCTTTQPTFRNLDVVGKWQ